MKWFRNIQGGAVRLLIAVFCSLLPLVAHADGKRSFASFSESFVLYYVCDSVNVDENYLRNKENLDKIKEYLQFAPRIDSIAIYSWASPEGAYSHNTWLSQERGKAARQVILDNLPEKSNLTYDKIYLNPQSENWLGLHKLVSEKYNRHDRNKVLSILENSTISDETRKWRLKQLDGGYTWRYLIRHYMPELRSATWVCVWVEDITPLERLAVIKDSLVAESAPIAREETQEANFADEDSTEMTSDKRTIIALKSNLLLDAVTALNYEIEVPINKHFSVLFEQNTPWWLSKDNKRCLEFLSFGGEFRWWFAPRTKAETADRKLRDALMGPFLGVHCWGGKADIQWADKFGCYQFDFISAGLTYGYSMPISNYLNLEFSISAGYANIPYQHYIPTDDWAILIKDKNNAGTLHYFGPTKAEISLVIPIRAKINKKGGAK